MSVNNLVKKLYDKVINILEWFEQARNSDIFLRHQIWIKYHPDKLFKDPVRGWCVALNDEYSLPNQDDIKRVRAKIQNDEKMFIPTNWEVAKQRKWLEGEWKEALGYTEWQRESKMRDQEFKKTVESTTPQKPLFDINSF